MDNFKNILVVQTAFLGDVILTLPLVQEIKKRFPAAGIDVVVVPGAAPLLSGHPAIRKVVVYDKRGADAGLTGLFRHARALRAVRYDAAFVPHRSIRSAALVALASIPNRIGFNRSAGRFLFTKTLRYDPALHEVDRNLSLLQPFSGPLPQKTLPQLYPSSGDRSVVDAHVSKSGMKQGDRLVGIAPGSVWNTKRWLKERYVELAKRLCEGGSYVVIIGGEQDAGLCREIAEASAEPRVFSIAGSLTLLQSAELIRRCTLLISNDSAPVHLATAMQTPVVAIFGPTLPGFGFAPYGPSDVVLQTSGLSCRPCSTHGGDVCPVTTFECMKNISVERVCEAVRSIMNEKKSISV